MGNYRRASSHLLDSGEMADAAITRLKKLVAAKDAQIEALTSRIEVLSDDLHELKSEHEYAVLLTHRSQEGAASMQRELSSHRVRAARLEADLLAAGRRANEAERALDTAEMAFADELQQLKEAIRSSSPSPQVHAPLQDDRRGSNVEALESLCSSLRAFEDSQSAPNLPPNASPLVPVKHQSTASAATSPAIGPGFPTTSGPKGSMTAAEADTSSPDAVRAHNHLLRDEVAGLRAANVALRAELDSANDQLIWRTEAEIAALGAGGAPISVSGDADSPSAAPPSPPEPAQPAFPPTRVRSPAQSTPEPVSPRLVTQMSGGGIEERTRWRRELEVQMARDAAHNGGALVARPGGAPHSPRHATAQGGACAPRHSYTSGRPSTGASLAALGPPSFAPRGGIGSPTGSPTGRRGGTKHAHASLGTKQSEQRAAEQQVHDQIRALLVAKETALSAVAAL